LTYNTPFCILTSRKSNCLSIINSGLDETAARKVKVGDIGFWPPENAIAIFFGPTPMSSGADPFLASAVCLIGRITDDATLL
jgi:hypothetical protein